MTNVQNHSVEAAPPPWLGVKITWVHIGDSWYAPSSLLMVGVFRSLFRATDTCDVLVLIKMAVSYPNCQHH